MLTNACQLIPVRIAQVGHTTKRAKLLTDRKGGTTDCDCFHIVIIHLCSGYVLQKLLQTRIAAGREQRLR